MTFKSLLTASCFPKIELRGAGTEGGEATEVLTRDAKAHNNFLKLKSKATIKMWQDRRVGDGYLHRGLEG